MMKDALRSTLCLPQYVHLNRQEDRGASRMVIFTDMLQI